MPSVGHKSVVLSDSKVSKCPVECCVKDTKDAFKNVRGQNIVFRDVFSQHSERMK